MKDAIAFMAWERVVPWKILSMMARPNKSLVPLGFGARYHDFYKLLEPGSRIWIVTRISREFSLAGCVGVRMILDRNELPREKWPEEAKGLLAQWRYVALADQASSKFYETNNAAHVLAKHQVAFAQNRTIVYRDGSLQDSFSSCIEQARETVFLSYRWNKGRRFAIALAREFRNVGLSPWLDALSMPRYEASREKGVDAPRLQTLIELGIEKSQFAVAINTEGFGRKTWTKMELDHIRKTKPWFQVMRGGSAHPCDEPPILSRKPDVIVDEILGRRALAA